MRILFVDDEKRRMSGVVDELREAGHEVLFFDEVDAALRLVRQPVEILDLAVLDVSMPSGEEYQFDDTDGGSRTGLLLYTTLRDVRPRLKIVVLTNVSDRRVASHFSKEDPELCLFLRKPDILPFQFVEAVTQFVQEGEAGT